MNSQTCPSCNKALGPNDNFCQKCGAPAKVEAPPSKAHIKSSGTYSGKMTKGGGRLFKRILYTLLFLLIAGGAAVFIWFQMDPNAGKKFKDTLDTAGAILVVLLFIWVFFKGKSGKRGGRREDDDWDNDNDFGDDDD